MDKGRKWIVILLVSILALNIFQNIRISELENDLRGQRHSFDRINRDINQIDKNVYVALEDWERENRWVRDSGYEIISVSDDLKNMTISVFWDFNSLKNDEKVYLHIGKLSDNNSKDILWEKIAVEPIGDLHYEKQLTLPFEESYTIEVLAENHSEKRSEELDEIDIYNRIINRIQVNGRTRTTRGNELYLDISLFNTDVDLELFNDREPTKTMAKQLKIDEAKLEIYVKGKLLETVDLLKDGTYDDYPDDEMIDYFKEFEDPEFEEKDLEAIVKIKDKLGLEYEREVELDR